MYKKNPVVALHRQLYFRNVDGDVYFHAGRGQQLDIALQHPRDYMQFLDLCAERTVEVICSAKANVLCSKKQDGREKIFAGCIQVLSG